MYYSTKYPIFIQFKRMNISSSNVHTYVKLFDFIEILEFNDYLSYNKTVCLGGII